MDKISIKKVKVFANHGVLEAEKKEGQFFFISIDILGDFNLAARQDDINKAVNYDLVTKRAVQVFTENCFNLIETAASRICEVILEEFSGARMVSVTVDKPSAPVDAEFENISCTITKKWETAYLSLGSNIPKKDGVPSVDKKEESFFCLDGSDEDRCLLDKDEVSKSDVLKASNLKEAMGIIEALPGIRLNKSSAFYLTKPWGYKEQEDFVNNVCEISTYLSPYELLYSMQAIENDMGRVKDLRWGPRIIDIDIVLYGDEVISDEELIIPHENMCNRDFVMVPLSEIAPYAVHPVYKKYMKDFEE